MSSLDVPIDEVSLAFLDVETTGLNPAWGDRVCEVAIVRYRGDEALDALQQLVDPQRPMGVGAYRVHGISDEMLRDAPIFPQVAGDMLELLDGAALVAHNAPFDLGFLAEELRRMGAALPELVVLDTLPLARALYRLRSYALPRLAAALNVSIEGRAHRAMADVLLTRKVFGRICEDASARGRCTMQHLLRLQGGSPVIEQKPRLNIPPLIAQALRDHHLLNLHYLSENGAETRRLVRPMGVSERGGTISLVAHCYLRDELRYFRLDRILEMEIVASFES